MKIVKFSLILVAAVAAIIGLSTASYAFHSGGVAECMGCHNIHDGQSASALLIAGRHQLPPAPTLLPRRTRQQAATTSSPRLQHARGVPPRQ